MYVQLPDARRCLSVLLLLLCLVVIAGCRREQTTPTAGAPTSVANTEPTETVASVTETPAATETPEPTETPVPTETPIPTETPAYTPEFEEASCEFEVLAERDVRCGFLTVPEDRANPENGNVVRLHVAIFASEAEQPAPDPILYLEGGPGSDALETVGFVFEDRFAPFLAEHEFIMFDQRGTGYSEPSLACPEYTEVSLEMLDDILTPEEEAALFLETMTTCRDRLLDEGVDLSAYDSAANAADVEDLRRALDYEQVNLYGISYGTRLALTVMRDYPDGIRSVILDSAYPLEVDIVSETPANLRRALDVFFAGCESDPACNGAYPDLETFFFDLAARVDEEPISVPVFHAFTGEQYTARLDGTDLLGVLFQGLYSEEIIPLLPQFIYDTAAGDYEILSLLLSNLILSDEFVSLGMNFSVQCQDEIPFSDPSSVAEAVEDYPELEPYFETSATSGILAFETCELWGVTPADAIENEVVSSEIPTLVLAGEYDPITPPAWGRQVQENLLNSYYYEFPGLGHGVSVAGECPQSITMAFLADPEAVPDGGCIESLTGPAFVVPSTASETVELVPFESDMMGLTVSGVVPDGWEEEAPGVYLRQETAIDQALILQQAYEGPTAEMVLTLFSEQLGVELAPEDATPLSSGGRTWMLYETETQGALLNIAVVEEGDVTYLVALASTADEHDALYESVLIPVLAAIKVEP